MTERRQLQSRRRRLQIDGKQVTNYLSNTRTAATRKLLMAGILCLVFPLALAQQVLKIGHSDYSAVPNDVTMKIVAKAAEQAHLQIEFLSLPLARSAAMANNGEIDGELIRIADIAQMFPNLMIVPTPIYRDGTAVYFKNPKYMKSSRHELSQLKTVILQNLYVARKHTQGMQVEEASNEENAFNMLMNDRVDQFITLHGNAEAAIKHLKIRVTRHPNYWRYENFYFILNKKHEDLVPVFNKEFKKLQANQFIHETYVAAMKAKGLKELAPPLP